MLPIQKSQFIAQCKAYIELNDQLTRMIENLIPEEAEHHNRCDQRTSAFDSFRQRYLNQQIRAIHNNSIQHLHEQMEAIYLPNSSEIIEEPQVPIIPIPIEYPYEEPPFNSVSTDSPETLCSLDVQIALLQEKGVSQPQPIPAAIDVISEILNLPNSPLLEDNITGEWNLEHLFDCVSDTDSAESLVIDTDYESEKEKGLCDDK